MASRVYPILALTRFSLHVERGWSVDREQCVEPRVELLQRALANVR